MEDLPSGDSDVGGLGGVCTSAFAVTLRSWDVVVSSSRGQRRVCGAALAGGPATAVVAAFLGGQDFPLGIARDTGGAFVGA